MALALHWPSVEYGLQFISSREITEWIAYDMMIEPIGERRADIRSGIISAVIAEVNRDKKRRSKPYSPEEFMPKFEIAKPKTSEQMLEVAKSVTMALNEDFDDNDS